MNELIPFDQHLQVPDVLPASLHQLYLEYNSIDSLPEGFLGGFSHLQYIRMSHNQLSDKGIPSNTFNVSGLVELDLSYNKLERIPSVSSTLQHLYLQANQIKGKYAKVDWSLLFFSLIIWLRILVKVFFSTSELADFFSPQTQKTYWIKIFCGDAA